MIYWFPIKTLRKCAPKRAVVSIRQLEHVIWVRLSCSHHWKCLRVTCANEMPSSRHHRWNGADSPAPQARTLQDSGCSSVPLPETDDSLHSKLGYQTNFRHRKTRTRLMFGNIQNRQDAFFSVVWATSPGTDSFIDKKKTSLSKWLITLFPVHTVERLLSSVSTNRPGGAGVCLLMCLLFNITVFSLSIPTFCYWCTKVHIWRRRAHVPAAGGRIKSRECLVSAFPPDCPLPFRVETCCGSGSRRLRGDRDQANLPWLRHQGLSHLKGTWGSCRKTRFIRSIGPFYLPSMIKAVVMLPMGKGFYGHQPSCHDGTRIRGVIG